MNECVACCKWIIGHSQHHLGEYVECRGKLKDWRKTVRRLVYEKLPEVTEEDLYDLANDLEVRRGVKEALGNSLVSLLLLKSFQIYWTFENTFDIEHSAYDLGKMQ